MNKRIDSDSKPCQRNASAATKQQGLLKRDLMGDWANAGSAGYAGRSKGRNGTWHNGTDKVAGAIHDADLACDGGDLQVFAG